MDDNGSHAVRDNNHGHGGMRLLSWLALLLSLLALGLAYMAYQRSGADLSNEVQQKTDQAQDAAGNAADKAEDKAQDAGQAIDAGPDGVDEDDTDATTTPAPAPTTTPQP